MTHGWAVILLTISFAQDPQAPQPWALPDERFGVRTVPLLLLSRPDVRADLDLSPKQVRASEKAISRLREQAAALRDHPTDQAGLSARRAVDEAQYRWIEENLSAAQQARLREIDRQWEGPSILLTRSDVTERLGISSVQRRTIAAAIEAYPYDRSRREEAVKVVRDALNETQQETWDILWGRPFALKPQEEHTATATGVSSAASASKERP